MKRLKYFPCLLPLLIGLSALGATNYQSSVTLAWEPSPSVGVVGYNIYYGIASSLYTNKTAVGNVTNATVTKLKQATTYYFSATATDGNLESDFSNEVSYTVPGVLPPANLVPIAILVEQSTNMINWTSMTNFTLTYVGTTNNIRYYRARMAIGGQ